MPWDDHQPLNLKDRRALKRMMGVPGWWDSLPKKIRKQVMGKVLSALAKATTARDIGTLMKCLTAADRNDIERAKVKAVLGSGDSRTVVDDDRAPAEMHYVITQRPEHPEPEPPKAEDADAGHTG